MEDFKPKDYLPEKNNSDVKRKIDIEEVSLEKKKGNPLFDDMKETLFMGVVESIMPKVKPFLEPAIKKLDEYFGNDEKFFIMKKFGDTIKVIIVNNIVQDKEKGSYDISRYFEEEENKYKKTFILKKGCVIANIDIREFMEKMLTGELTKM